MVGGRSQLSRVGAEIFTLMFVYNTGFFVNIARC